MLLLLLVWLISFTKCWLQTNHTTPRVVEAYAWIRWWMSAALTFRGQCLYPLKKSGQLMTHHSGQIPSRQGTCTRIEECRHTDTHHHSIMYKSEVIDKDIWKKGLQHDKCVMRKKEKEALPWPNYHRRESRGRFSLIYVLCFLHVQEERPEYKRAVGLLYLICGNGYVDFTKA